jgi:D-alanyl-D-alanine dipeptidase
MTGVLIMRFLLPLLLALSLFLSGCGQAVPAEPSEGPPAEPAEKSDLIPTPDSEPAPDSVPVPEPLPEPAPEDLVLVTDYVPGIQVDLKYAGEDNFTGQVIYDFSEAYLRYSTIQKLAAVQEILSAEGYSLLIWDAFRPVEAQFRLWEVCPNPVYVANPERGYSSHSRGNTVDVTLALEDGTPAEMPTGFDDFSPLADRNYSDVPEIPAANARLLEDVMADCGFQPYSGEWWHFSDTDSYPVEADFVPGK